MKASYSFSENTAAQASPCFQLAREEAREPLDPAKAIESSGEPVFHPRDFSLLSNCQAICLPYDGLQSLPPRRVYLKPHYLPSKSSYWEMHRAGKL